MNPVIKEVKTPANIKGIPWAVTFGNHDTEDIATHNANDISEVFDQFDFEKTGSLLYPEIQPDITGRCLRPCYFFIFRYNSIRLLTIYISQEAMKFSITTVCL